MGKKKQQFSDFYFFMQDKKKDVEKRLGRKVKTQELPSLLYTDWKNLPEAEKQKYRAMKDNARATTEKMDCRGIPLNELKRQEEEKKSAIESMKREIINVIDFHANGNALHNLSIFVASASYYCVTDTYEYSPAELAVVHFNLKDGIMKEHHVIFKPVIPKCYGFISREHSEQTHNLLSEHNEGVEDFDEVLHELNQFLGNDKGVLPPLYTLEESMEDMEAIFKHLCGDAAQYKVYSLDFYYQNLYSSVMPECAIPQSIAADMLTHCGLDYHPGMACEWHKNYQPDSGKYCTLSCARRWLFNMCDNIQLTEKFGIEPQEGKHLPRAAPVYGVVVNSFQHPNKKLQSTPGNQSPRRNSLQPSGASGWSTPTTETLTPLRKPDINPWARAGTSTPTSSVLSTSMTSVDDISECDFPVLGSKSRTTRSAVVDQADSFSGGVGRGVLRSPGPIGEGAVGRNQNSYSSSVGVGRGFLRKPPSSASGAVVGRNQNSYSSSVGVGRGFLRKPPSSASGAVGHSSGFDAKPQSEY